MLVIVSQDATCILCRRKAKKRKGMKIAEEDPYIKRATNITSQVIEIDYSKEEGEVELHDALPDNGQDSEPNDQTLRLAH